jgi:hypothetical protein
VFRSWACGFAKKRWPNADAVVERGHQVVVRDRLPTEVEERDRLPTEVEERDRLPTEVVRM